jgi:hypothetical protein
MNQHYLGKTTRLLMNVALQHMAILLYIQKAQGSNLSPETGYPKRLLYSSIPLGKCLINGTIISFHF